MASDFERQLVKARYYEDKITKWLISQGWAVVRLYAIEEGKRYTGPRIYTDENEIIAPDYLISKNQEVYWAELKYKSIFTWYRKTESWLTGIDLRQYNQYLQAPNAFPLDIILFFLQKPGGGVESAPSPSPGGLYYEKLNTLIDCEDHRWDYGRNPMVYWKIDSLQKIAEFDEVAAEPYEKTISFSPHS